MGSRPSGAKIFILGGEGGALKGTEFKQLFSNCGRNIYENILLVLYLEAPDGHTCIFVHFPKTNQDAPS